MEIIKAVTNIIKVIDNLSSGTTQIDKMHQTYNFNSKKKVLSYLLFVVNVALVIFPTFYLSKWLHPNAWFIAVLLLFVIGLIVFSANKIIGNKLTNGDRDYLLPLFSALLTGVSSSAIFDIIFSFLDGKFRLDYIVFLFLAVAILGMAIWITFTFFKSFFKPNEYILLKILLNNGKEHDVKLLSITKQGDFIVEVLNEPKYTDCEVQINKLEIQQVILNKIRK